MAINQAPPRPTKPLTMSVKQYAKLAGVGEHAVYQEIAAGRLPHRRFGLRGLIRILRRPALAQLGFEEDDPV
jgi:excisionase family DNA binding protein